MLRLAKAFLDIALWRRTPAYLPASLFLLALVVCAAAVVEVLGDILAPGPHDGILTSVALGVGLPLAFAWAVLALARRRARFLQTATALLGVGILAELILYPLGAVYRALGEGRFLSIPAGIVLCVGLIWYLLACAHIWRSALDSGLVVGGIISVGYLLLSIALEQQMLSPT
ncbi:MAG: hypothetical protein M3N91_14000 [Pseudomonadota bacterium]|nr:hypothetical protein [Pseudomonadota bacterium]